MKLLLPIGLSLLSLSLAVPLTSYDQRQEGELNVKVDLDNFVIVVARPSSGLDLFGSMASLLADTKSNRAPAIPAAEDEPGKPEDEQPTAAEEKSKNLDDVSLDSDERTPSKTTKTNEEAVILLVQTDATIKSADEASKSLGEIARTLRNLKFKETGEKSKYPMSSKYKFVDSVDQPQSLKLIGDAVENCGPGRSRDRFGICKQE